MCLTRGSLNIQGFLDGSIKRQGRAGGHERLARLARSGGLDGVAQHGKHTIVFLPFDVLPGCFQLGNPRVDKSLGWRCDRRAVTETLRHELERA